MKRLIMVLFMLVVSVTSYSVSEWELVNTNPQFVREYTKYMQQTETLANGDTQSVVMFRDGIEEYYRDTKFLLLPPTSFNDSNCRMAQIFKIQLGDTEIPKDQIMVQRFPDNYRAIYIWFKSTEISELFVDAMLEGIPVTIYLKDADVKTIFTINNTNFKELFEKSLTDFTNIITAKEEKARLEKESEVNSWDQW